MRYTKPLPNLTDNDIARFWSKVDKTKGCWEWIGSRVRTGYGQFGVGGRRVNGGDMYLAHRISWIIHYGNIPAGLCVLHHCDNPACVNPQHLFLGTDKDNAVDRDKKGRRNIPKGESNHNSKLTNNDVQDIRWLYASGDYTITELGNKYHVAHSTISRAITRQCWKEVE